MKTPLISIIIPVYNTGDKAVKLLDRLVKDRYESLYRYIMSKTILRNVLTQ